MSRIDINTDPLIQSGYTNLQVVGSDGTDNTVPGYHLRWDFLNSLGENHIAKGNLYNRYETNVPLNNSDDYVKIFRTSFSGKKYFVKIDFKATPAEISEGDLREWQYTLPVNEIGDTYTDIIIRFINTSLYDQIRKNQGSLDTLALLASYSGLIEVEPQNNKLSFYYEFDLNFDTNGILRVETISIPDTLNSYNKQISCRKKINSTNTQIYGENIKYIRFDCSSVQLNFLYIITYEDFIYGINLIEPEGGWEHVDDFALTLDDSTIENRLMNKEIDRLWPKFENTGTDDFTIKCSNYLNRWSMSNGLKEFVDTYLQYSSNDSRAIVTIPSDISTENNTQTVSYIDLLRLLSLDYHIARMLGLGFIDKSDRIEEGITYIYCLQYKTYCDLTPPFENSSEKTHIYMSLPTKPIDKRLPKAPVLTIPSFGTTVNNGTDNPTNLTDINGYVPYGNMRFININRGVSNFERPFGPFYYESIEFCLSEETQPISFGLKYKSSDELSFRKPELCHDIEYTDYSGIPETMPILNTGLKIYTHLEEEEGIHEYNAYSINWFSRVSELSNEIEISTQFPLKSSLLPPFNLAVQLIQDEDPTESNINEKTLIFTTKEEQQLLSNISNDILVRTTFDWNYVHHNAHNYADYAEIFFKKDDPLVVKGKVFSVNDISEKLVEVSTTSYQLNSTKFPSQIIEPIINTGEETRFIGSYFCTGNNNFLIKDVVISANNSVFILEKIKQVEVFPTPNNLSQNHFQSLETYTSPIQGDLFFIIENLTNPANWDLRHSKKVYLEKFFTNSKIGVRFSNNRIEYFDITSINYNGSDTEIYVSQKINFNLTAGMNLEYAVKHSIIGISGGQFEIDGDKTQDFTNGNSLRVFGSKENDRLYTIDNSFLSNGKTYIQVLEPITNEYPKNGEFGIIEVIVNKSNFSINQENQLFILNGNSVDEIDLAHIEFKTEDDGSLTRFVVGGLNDTVTLEPILDGQNEHTGYIKLSFDSLELINHIDSDVVWDKGIVRLTDVSGQKQPYPVTFIGNLAGERTIPLTLIIKDPGFIPDTGSGCVYSLDLGISNSANYHPSYKIYLKDDNGLQTMNDNLISYGGTHFNDESILPSTSDFTEGNRKSFISVRAIDVKKELFSYNSNPSVLLAQRITVPETPGLSQGPLYATRPNFYGKSTYTFDTEVNTTGRIPYSVVFYRSNEEMILNVLYKKSTQATIWENLNALTDAKAKFDPELWKILFTADNNGSGFKTYTTSTGSFTWPKPDNDEYFISFETNKVITSSNYSSLLPDGYVKPFNETFTLNSNIDVYGKTVSSKDIIKKAILSVFLPLTEQPPVYNYIKEGKQTSSTKAKSRDTNGNIIDPIDNDIFPMIKRYSEDGKTMLRFTDYTLDGASANFYFYLTLEMTDKLKYSDIGLPLGPVLMVNSSPVDKPQIKKVISIIQDELKGNLTSINIEINNYLDSDGVTKIELYRALNEVDALSIRLMKKVKTFDFGENIIDDFSDLQNPPFGEKLYYRIIAIREIEDVEDILNSENTITTSIPSVPSEIVTTNVVDTQNPTPPILSSFNSASSSSQLENVVINWNSTCYNGTYHLQKLNPSGNWIEIYSVKSNDSVMQYPPIDISTNEPDFTNYSQTALLLRTDGDGNPIYHRFRVQVENSSGLFNLYQDELTLARGESDLFEIGRFFNYSDLNSNYLESLTNYEFIKGESYPSALLFELNNIKLPAGHNNILNIEISVTDDLDNNYVINIENPNVGDIIKFNNGDGSLVLDDSNPNRKYNIVTSITTDFVNTLGDPISYISKSFTLNYLAGPSYELSKITSLVALIDDTFTLEPLISGNINNGVSYPGHISIRDISDLTLIGQTFDYMEITITDDLSNSYTKTINSIGDSVDFNQGDGSLELDSSSPNRKYEIKVKIITLECVAGVETVYNVSYTHSPYDDLAVLTDIVAFLDYAGNEINPLIDTIITATDHPNGSIRFTDIIGSQLPSGHTFEKIDVFVEDNLGGSCVNTINSIDSNVYLNRGENNLVLDGSNPNRTFNITVTLYTDLCLDGYSYYYIISYT